MKSSRYFATKCTGDTLVAVLDRRISSLSDTQLLDERSNLIEEIQDSEVRAVIIDFANVEFFGSLVLDTLCMVWKHARERGVSMAVCNVSDVGQEILGHSKLNSLWPAYPSLERAAEASRSADSEKRTDFDIDMPRDEPAHDESPSRLRILQSGAVTVVGFGGGDLPPEHILGRYRDEIDSLIEFNRCREFAFDLTGIKTVPSGFLGVVASVLKKGVQVSVRNPSPAVREGAGADQTLERRQADQRLSSRVRSGEQAAGELGLGGALDPLDRRRRPHVDVVRSRRLIVRPKASSKMWCRPGVDLLQGPHVVLRVLDPLEVRHRHAARVGQNVRAG